MRMNAVFPFGRKRRYQLRRIPRSPVVCRRLLLPGVAAIPVALQKRGSAEINLTP
jgi:hypothetical protein